MSDTGGRQRRPTTAAHGGDGSDEFAEYLHVDDCTTDFTQGVTDDTIKIGSSFPQSGTFAAFAEISTGYQAYFDYVNEELGGVDGRQIEFVALDDGYEPGRTATNVQRLVHEDGVFALFNVIGTANNRPSGTTSTRSACPTSTPGRDRRCGVTRRIRGRSAPSLATRSRRSCTPTTSRRTSPTRRSRC